MIWAPFCIMFISPKLQPPPTIRQVDIQPPSAIRQVNIQPPPAIRQVNIQPPPAIRKVNIQPRPAIRQVDIQPLPVIKQVDIQPPLAISSHYYAEALGSGIMWSSYYVMLSQQQGRFNFKKRNLSNPTSFIRKKTKFFLLSIIIQVHRCWFHPHTLEHNVFYISLS